MIEEDLYLDTLLDVARDPKNRGSIANPDFEAKRLNPLCGDEVRIQVEIQKEKGSIEKAVFSGSGCAISQASASLLAEKIEGKSLAEVKFLKSDDILELLGINPSPARLKCALLSLEVLMEALKNGSEG